LLCERRQECLGRAPGGVSSGEETRVGVGRTGRRGGTGEAAAEEEAPAAEPAKAAARPGPKTQREKK